MESLPVRRIHIDSRQKTDGRDSHSDFKIRLAQSVSLPEDACMILDNISIPNTFRTINRNENSLYIAEVTVTQPLTVVCRKIDFDESHYNVTTLAMIMALKFNYQYPAVMGLNPYRIVYQPELQNFKITNIHGYNFHILSDDAIAAFPNGFGGLTIDKNFPNSINTLIRNESNGNATTDPNAYSYGMIFETGIVTVQSQNNVYIHSNLADNNVMTPKGMSDCIACVPISAPTGTVAHHNATNHADAVNVSKRSFETLTFQLRNSKGQIVDLGGASWSCSLLFFQKL